MRLNFVIILFTLVACHPDKLVPIEVEELRYRTSDASELYFKNIRQSNYQVELRKEAGINLYRPNDPETENLVLKPVLLINWRHDMAYLILESDQNPETLRVVLGSDTVTYESGNPKQNTQLATQIYNAILLDQEVRIFSNGKMENLFSEATQKDPFRTTMFDFFRLVDLR